MFGLFKSPSFRDPQLGELTRSRGNWRGALALGSAAPVPLVLSGTRSVPDPRALALAKDLASRFPSWQTAIAAALFEHYSPYGDARAAGEILAASASLPPIAEPNGVWPAVALVHVCVTPLAGELTTELGYTTAWDEEHRLGIRFQVGRLVELCGSVLPP